MEDAIMPPFRPKPRQNPPVMTQEEEEEIKRKQQLKGDDE